MFQGTATYSDTLLTKTYIGLREHLLFLFSSAALLIALLTLLRVALLVFNRELIGTTAWSSLAEAFLNGLRFDLRLVVYICLPLSLAVTCRPSMVRRTWQRIWLGACALIATLLGMIELNFYREFHQRLNALVFQYMQEDPSTVLSMLWYGFPVLRLVAAWLALSGLFWILLSWVDKRTRGEEPTVKPSLSRISLSHGMIFVACVLISVIAARGTLRQGPPLRWGDAFTTDSIFANHLGLNGTLSLYDSAKKHYSSDRANKIWKNRMSTEQAITLTRGLLLTENDRIVDQNTAAVRRNFQAPENTHLPVRNVVVILMESFSGHFVGALGSDLGITPYFDQLAQEGLLFQRFFSSGTHTHQGMFATMACFPNLPGFEYLMQIPEGSHLFSGLPQLLSLRGFDDLYVYNGDFAWDNQRGFFSNQGMTRFIGRNDFINPVVSDPTWGVADQDMFGRAAEELARQDPEKPFYALLQTLSNHTPYALPEVLPIQPVTGQGSFDQRLTAMRYSDWALGQFFEKARKEPYFKDTLFVVVGDHGFGAREQLTEMDLYRFHVPLLLIAPGIQETFGKTRDTVGSQVDIVPTIMGRLGQPVRHQCWGRDLLSLPADDEGFAIIKPSGGEQTVAMINGEKIVVLPVNMAPRSYQYSFGSHSQSVAIQDTEQAAELSQLLQAYVQTATASLLNNSAGIVDNASINSDVASNSSATSSRQSD